MLNVELRQMVVYKYIFGFLLSFWLTVMFSGCYDLTVRVVSLPANTPLSEPIYISGNFNNWDPGDPDYILTLNSDSILEVELPKGIGDIEYKFTRGDWSTVEKDPCGFEISNRTAFYGRDESMQDTIRSWNDLPKPGCPSFRIIIESLPADTPENPVFFFASNINDWDPGSRYWMFTSGPDGQYYIDVPRPGNEKLEYKITRGNWNRVEVSSDGEQISNREFWGKAGEEVRITIERWNDRR